MNATESTELPSTPDVVVIGAGPAGMRSEEHTSELQSH